MKNLKNIRKFEEILKKFRKNINNFEEIMKKYG